ncbi:unnamed protein product [Blepharisma stoltei]|uniref:PHD-type domain-containing protein n=1 Tax=Blepharisma stoltei TaxID=1481888 RepID=A0AAU9IRX2_9CILI|nr:unnamed protein product [Blepharisma stoltei]
MMLDPDIFFEDSMEKQRLRSSIKIPRQQPNYHKLNTERMIVPIVLNVSVRPNLIIRDRFDWDLSRQYRSPYVFVEQLGDSLGLSEDQKRALANSIIEQIIEHIEKYTIQTRTRIPKKLEENAASNLTCLQCGSILYNNDICRACGVSLEKLRQKYGNLTGLGQESKINDEESIAPRQTERQRTLESTRRRQEPSMAGSRKACTRCGEANHPMSIECRQCLKPITKAPKKIRSLNEALTYHFWKILNRESQFAQMVLMNDTIKEEDFLSANKLYDKLKVLIAECEHPPVSASSIKVNHMLLFLDICYEKILTGTATDQLQVHNSSSKNQIELKELDYSQIHVSNTVPEQPAYQATYFPQIDYRKKMLKPEVPGRRRGRPRKYPLPETISREPNEQQDEEEGQAKLKEENDQSMNECGMCGEPGQLICCEVCPSVYHLACLNLRNIPKGKWMCFFCRIVKDGIDKVRNDDSGLAEDFNNLLQPSHVWQNQAQQIVDILLMNPCSKDISTGGARGDIPPPDLVALKDLINEGHYKNLEEVDYDIRVIFKQASKMYKKRNQTLYSQVFNLQLFHNKMLSELQNLCGIQINTQPINFPNSKPGDPYKKPKYE